MLLVALLEVDVALHLNVTFLACNATLYCVNLEWICCFHMRSASKFSLKYSDVTSEVMQMKFCLFATGAHNEAKLGKLIQIR
eukprot:c8747_g1_i1 orf=276-521(+)